MMDKRENDMALSLYEEAIAEAKQLRDVAEQNAKNKIIDAVTPKIRRLIEKQLLGEDDSSDEGDEELDDLAFLADEPAGDELAGDEVASEVGHDEPDGDEMMTIDLDDLGMSQVPDDMSMELPGDQADMSFDASGGEDGGPSVSVPAGVDVDVEIGADGSVSLDTGAVDLHVGGEGGGDDGMDAGDELLLDEPVAEALSRLVQHRKTQTKKALNLEQKLNHFEKKLRKFYALVEALDGKRLSSSQRAIVRNHYTKLLREIGSLQQKAILIECGSSGRLHRRTVSILKEMKKMSRSSRRRTARGNTNYLRKLLENTGLDEFDLFEEEEDELAAEEGGEEEMDLEDEGGEGEVDVDSAQAAIEDLGAALGLDVVVEPEGEEEEGEEEDLEDEGGEEEIEFESQLYGESDKEDDDEEVVEIDESTLRNELRRLKRRRQGRRYISEETSGVDEPSQTADAFGGGDVEDEIFVDVDEATLLNALADELGDAPKPSVGSGGDTDAMTAEGRRRRRNTRARQTNRFNESRKNRALTNKLSEYKKAVGSLRGQLTEMNLFNAKLLYANKLMQNRNLSPKQQRAIVEALDGAKPLREAKLLYKSLTNSLGRTGSRALKDSAVRRTSGSSSRSTRSARPAQNGVEVDRWAVLAGIPGKDSK